MIISFLVKSIKNINAVQVNECHNSIVPSFLKHFRACPKYEPFVTLKVLVVLVKLDF